MKQRTFGLNLIANQRRNDPNDDQPQWLKRIVLTNGIGICWNWLLVLDSHSGMSANIWWHFADHIFHIFSWDGLFFNPEV